MGCSNLFTDRLPSQQFQWWPPGWYAPLNESLLSYHVKYHTETCTKKPHAFSRSLRYPVTAHTESDDKDTTCKRGRQGRTYIYSYQLTVQHCLTMEFLFRCMDLLWCGPYRTLSGANNGFFPNVGNAVSATQLGGGLGGWWAAAFGSRPCRFLCRPLPLHLQWPNKLPLDFVIKWQHGTRFPMLNWPTSFHHISWGLRFWWCWRISFLCPNFNIKAEAMLYNLQQQV